MNVVFDFDGVINSYKSGWQGAATIPDEPVDGIKEAIRDIRQVGYKVIVVSSRCSSTGGIKAIRDWLTKWEIVVDDVTGEKVPAIVYVDDRALTFDGDPSSLLEKIRHFKPWHKKN